MCCGSEPTRRRKPWERRGWNLYGIALLEDVAGGLQPDGTVNIIALRSDIGLNAETAYCQIVAEELGIVGALLVFGLLIALVSFAVLTFTRVNPVWVIIAAATLDDLYLSDVTMAEIRFGIERVSDPLKRAEIASWLDHVLRPLFGRRVLGALSPEAQAALQQGSGGLAELDHQPHGIFVELVVLAFA